MWVEKLAQLQFVGKLFMLILNRGGWLDPMELVAIPFKTAATHLC